ncbi:unnamed protein product [Vitrella brassicaformis CCMP3155]|uniref:Glycosyltransferase 2-like domain-containing protein n=2 Tax=Vitrella brassicaformis TaxID=1169539 RepID=A0A0G4ENW8_VITBC|nr:unnamed protein product [Vitrella brassicaformis CCMP3155]|eukprot:CEL99109.1 unnamed protein product [Vitrella brassicaformis CCMP3155]
MTYYHEGWWSYVVGVVGLVACWLLLMHINGIERCVLHLECEEFVWERVSMSSFVLTIVWYLAMLPFFVHSFIGLLIPPQDVLERITQTSSGSRRSRRATSEAAPSVSVKQTSLEACRPFPSSIDDIASREALTPSFTTPTTSTGSTNSSGNEQDNDHDHETGSGRGSLCLSSSSNASSPPSPSCSASRDNDTTSFLSSSSSASLNSSTWSPDPLRAHFSLNREAGGSKKAAAKMTHRRPLHQQRGEARPQIRMSTLQRMASIAHGVALCVQYGLMSCIHLPLLCLSCLLDCLVAPISVKDHPPSTLKSMLSNGMRLIDPAPLIPSITAAFLRTTKAPKDKASPSHRKAPLTAAARHELEVNSDVDSDQVNDESDGAWMRAHHVCASGFDDDTSGDEPDMHDGRESDQHGKVIFRVVTRGDKPALVASVCERNIAVLDETLQNDAGGFSWRFEVVTDRPIGVKQHFIDREQRTTPDDHRGPTPSAAVSLGHHNQQQYKARRAARRLPSSSRIDEIVVPDSYVTAKGTKFKARALNYANEKWVHAERDGKSGNSKGRLPYALRDNDLIVHLDEETLLHASSVRGIADFLQGAWNRIGMGTVVYGHGRVVNPLTTMSDSIRVCEDICKNRIYFNFSKPILGMKGSFIVMPVWVERLVGWDLGPHGSIAEDAAFALKAIDMGGRHDTQESTARQTKKANSHRASRPHPQQSIKFGFVKGVMHEQSPFDLLDYMKQRRRWFLGLWLVVRHPDIRWRTKLPLLYMQCVWALVPLWTLLGLVPSVIPPVPRTFILALFQTLTSGTWYWCFVYGSVLNFTWGRSPGATGGVRRWLDWLVNYVAPIVGTAVLIPLFGIFESASIIYSYVNPRKGLGFDVVKKDLKETNSKAETHTPDPTVLTPIPQKQDDAHPAPPHLAPGKSARSTARASQCEDTCSPAPTDGAPSRSPVKKSDERPRPEGAEGRLPAGGVVWGQRCGAGGERGRGPS